MSEHSQQRKEQKFFGPFFQKRTAWFLLVLVFAVFPQSSEASTYAQAIEADLAHDPSRALALYRQAAEAGMPEAQLNVAIMYDSGRGAARDAGQAALWYAQAAAGGMGRAAFDLAQLYAAGDGVPRNTGLAQAWFAQAARQGVAAAAGRAAAAQAGEMYSAPDLIYPAISAHVADAQGGVSLVWTQMPAPAPASFYIEAVRMEGYMPKPVFNFVSTVSAVRMTGATPGRYAWRVFLLCPSAGRYVPSDWAIFTVP